MRRRVRGRCLAALIAATAVLGCLAASGTDPAELRVTRGPARKTLAVTGRIVAARAETMRVPMLESWRTTVKWLAEEGRTVAAGDVVAQLDNTSQRTDLAEQETAVRNKRQERALRELDAHRERLDLEVKLNQARHDRETARVDAAVPAEMVKGGAREHQTLQLALARAEKKLAEAELALRTAAAKVESDLKRIDLELAGLEASLGRSRTQLDELTLRAKTAGVVLHAEHPWLGRKVRVGDSLQSTWPVSQIPDLGSLQVEAFVPESEAGLLAPGQRAVLRLDAFPARDFHGAVLSIAPRGEPRPQWGRSSFFRATLALDDGDASVMRPGMSIMAELEVAAVKDALLVPIAAARRTGELFRVRPRGRDPVEVRAVLWNEFVLAVAPAAGGTLADGDVLEDPHAWR